MNNTLHIVWLGPNKVDDTYFGTYKKYLPDFNIKIWNEHNFHSTCRYYNMMIARKKYAFAADYMRLKLLYEYGGVYLDTDVLIIKQIPKSFFNKSFVATEKWKGYIGTGLIMYFNNPKNIILKHVLDIFENYLKNDIINDGDVFSNVVNFLYPQYDYQDKTYNFDSLTIYDSSYFCPFNFKNNEMEITDNTYSIHWYRNSWKGQIHYSDEEINSFEYINKYVILNNDLSCITIPKNGLSNIRKIANNFYNVNRNLNYKLNLSGYQGESYCSDKKVTDKVFTVYRDPIDRFKSFYKNKWIDISGGNITKNIFKLSNPSIDILTDLVEQHLLDHEYYIDNHVRKLADFYNIDDIDYAIELKDLKKFLYSNGLCDDNYEILNKSDSNDIILTKEQEDRIKTIYEDDYKLYEKLKLANKIWKC